MAYKMMHACVSCVLLLSASAGVAAASGPAACPAGGFQLTGGACAKSPRNRLAGPHRHRL